MVKLTDNEWAILEVLWADGPCELGDLVSALAPTHPWRRNTVHTYLNRMESKGLVAIDRTQDPHRYTAAIDRELCARQARSQLLDKIYGGATGDLIAAFLKESHITPEERDRLRQLLDDMEV